MSTPRSAQLEELRQSKRTSALLNLIRAGVFAVFFLPLFVDQRFLFPFVGPRTIIFRILVAILLVAYACLIVVDTKYKPRWTSLHSLLAGFVGILILTGIVGVDPYHSFWGSVERTEGILTWLHFFVFFIILDATTLTDRRWGQFFTVIIASAWLQTVFALAQVLQLPFALASDTRVGGALGNASFLAAYLIFIIFLAAYRYSQTESRLARFQYGSLIVLDAVLIWRTQTRGAILALALGWLLFLSVYLWRRRTQASRLVLGGMLIGLIAAGSLLAVSRDADWIKRSGTLKRLVNISTQDITSSNRLIVWGVGTRAMLERPLTGWGWENFNAAFNEHFDPAITRDVGSRPWYDRAHNVLIEVGVATGIVGLTLYVLLLGWPLWRLWQARFENFKQRTGQLLLVSLFVAYIFQNLFVFDTFSSYTLLFFLLAYVSFLTRTPAAEEKHYRRRGLAMVMSAGIITACVMIPTVYYFNVRPALASYFTIEAVIGHKQNVPGMRQAFEKAFLYSPPNDQELRFILVQHTRDQMSLRGINDETIPLIQLAISEMTKSVQAAPYYIQNYLLLSELYLALSAVDPNGLVMAEQIALEALDRAPQRYQVYTLLGRIQMSKADFAQGIEYFARAILLNDNFAEAHWNLGIAYILSHQFDQADQALQAADERGFELDAPENIQRLFAAYRDAGDIDQAIDFMTRAAELYPENQNYAETLSELKQLRQ